MMQAAGSIPQAQSGLTRRQFLAAGWTVAGLVAAGEAGAAVLAFMYPRLEAGSFGGQAVIGSALEVNQKLPNLKARPDATFLHTGRFYLSRTPDGVLALYRKCVHMGCVVPWNDQEDQFHCPCHGSLYNRKGEVLGGPARRPLDLFPISVDGGNWVVDTGKVIQRNIYEPSQAKAL
jgi:cytochrome b6-f complex iron-sulfur subunit